MTDRDRLIELLIDSSRYIDEQRGEVIADYLLSIGVTVSPVAIGTTVYEIRAKGERKYALKHKNCDYSITKKGSFKNAIDYGLELYVKEKPYVKTDSVRWNKSIFLTKEEAEAKLRKIGEDNA